MAQERRLLEELGQAVLEGDQERALDLAARTLKGGISALDALQEGCIPGIRKAGDLWEEGEYFLPELVGAAQAMKSAMEVLRPGLGEAGVDRVCGRVVIGTIQGDIHDIGKTLVAALLEAAGFEVHDEGCDVPVQRFVDRAREIQADLVCISALLTTTMTLQRQVVDDLEKAGIPARVMVGGAPVSREWAEEIGAAGYADNAVAAVGEARRLVGLDDA